MVVLTGEAITVGITINVAQLILLFIVTFFAAITAAVIVAALLIGYLLCIAYLYKFYSEIGPFYALIDTAIISAVALLVVGLALGPSVMMTMGIVFLVPVIVVYFLAIYAPLKTEPETQKPIETEFKETSTSTPATSGEEPKQGSEGSEPC